MVKKSDPNKIINLQNGMFCHLAEGHLVINDDMNYDDSKDTFSSIDLSKTSNRKKLRIVFNVLYTSIIIGFALYSGFFPAMLLLFVSVFDLRQLKRYNLPINRSRKVPFQSIFEIRFTQGKLGFNYMDIIIEDEGKKSMIPLKLYDSKSSLKHAKALMTGINLYSEDEIEKEQKISGPFFPTSENAGYIYSYDAFHYTVKNNFDRSRLDNYLYLRLIAIFSVLFAISAFVAKIILMTENFINWVDYVALALFVMIAYFPARYIRKARPNIINKDEILGLKKKGKQLELTIKQSFPIPLKVTLLSTGKDDFEALNEIFRKSND